MSYVSPEYEPTTAVENFNGVPRFGHSDDITNLIDGDRLDYALGVIFIPCFMISAYIVWVVLISIFKFCKVRFVSGSNLEPGTSAFVIRSIFLFFNISAAIALVIYMTKGASSILDVIASVRNVSTSLSNTGEQAVELTDSLVTTSDQIIPLRDGLVQSINNGLCPADPATDATLSDLTTNLVSLLTELDNFFQDDILSLSEGFDNSLAESDEVVGEVLDSVENWIRFLPYTSIPFFIVVGSLLIGLIMTWFGSRPRCYTAILTCIVLPTLLASILSCIMASSILSVAGVGVSDLCLGGDTASPEGSIEAVMEQIDQLGGTALDLFEYYVVTGCRSENPLTSLDQLSDELQDTIDDMNLVVKNLQDNKAIYDIACGTDTEQTITQFTTVQDLLVKMDDALDLTMDITSCESINGIVIDVAHETTCNKIPTMIGWMFVSVTIFGICAMLMYTFRSACFPNEEEPSSDDENDEQFVMAAPAGKKGRDELKPAVIGDE